MVLGFALFGLGPTFQEFRVLAFRGFGIEERSWGELSQVS